MGYTGPMTSTDREHHWRGHLEAAQAHPTSLAAYCRETGVSYQSLMYWKRRLGQARLFIELPRPAPAASPTTPPVATLETGGFRLVLHPDCPPDWAAQLLNGLDPAAGAGAGEAGR